MQRLRAFSKGQFMVLYGLAAMGLLGAVALATDVGVIYYQWAQMQKAVDASALAAVHYLPNDPAGAATTAQAYAKGNGLVTSEVTGVTCIDLAKGSYSCAATGSQPAGFLPTELKVDASRTAPYYFARALGLASTVLGVTATANFNPSPTSLHVPDGQKCLSNNDCPPTTGSVSGTCGGSPGAQDILPIAVDNLTASQWVQGQSYTLNRVTATKGGNGPWPDAPGNWGAINLCNSNGGSAVRAAIANGFYGPISAGQTVSSEPGADVGNIAQGFQDRLALSTDNSTTFDTTDPRLVIVPLVNFAGCSGNCNLPVTGFMAFYIDSYSGGAINGHFVTMSVPDAYGNGLANNDLGLKGNAKLIK
jgi:Flp pilus assembly protein TadG